MNTPTTPAGAIRVRLPQLAGDHRRSPRSKQRSPSFSTRSPPALALQSPHRGLVARRISRARSAIRALYSDNDSGQLRLRRVRYGVVTFALERGRRARVPRRRSRPPDVGSCQSLWVHS